MMCWRKNKQENVGVV
jgi:hypothetical protein